MPPFSGGSYTTPVNSWSPAVTGTTINATDWETLRADLQTALSTTVLKDGSQTITSNLPMNSNKLTGLSAGSTAGDSLRYEQAVGVFLPLAGGTMTGDLLFTDATYDIGKSGATRPRDGFFSRNAVVGGTLGVTGVATLTAQPILSSLTASRGVLTDGSKGLISADAPLSNVLVGDVNLNNTGNYFDGPTVAQGTTGTWWVAGSVSCLNTAGASTINAKLWDGTTVIASAQIVTAGANSTVLFTFSGFISAPAGNLRISCNDQGSTSGKIKFNVSGNSKDASIYAMRIA